jgi:hypothetical protein
MIRFRPAFLTVTAALALVGCGGSDSDSIAVPPTVSVSSSTQAQLGSFSAGALVTYFRPDGTTLGTGTTDASGKAAVDLGSYTGPFTVRVSGAPGVTYYDEADGTNKPFGSAASLLAIVKGSVGGLNSVGVTPLTHAAARLAGLSAATPVLGSRSAADIDTANGQVATMFGLPVGFDITKPPTPVSAGATSLTGSSDASSYAAVLAALAISAKAGGVDPAASADSIAAQFGSTNPGQTNATIASLLANVRTLFSGGAVGGLSLANTLTLGADTTAKLSSFVPGVLVDGRVPLASEVTNRVTPPATPCAPTGATGATGGTGGSGGSSLGSVQTTACAT